MPLDDTNWSASTVDPTTALLIRARSFLERGWCQRTLALDATAQMVDPTSKRAVAWCAMGALYAAGVPGYRRHPAVDRLTAVIGDDDICDFNNHQETVEPILAAFDRAIGAG